MNTEQAIEEVIVRLGWTEMSIGVLLVAALQFLLGLWIKARLEQSIKHEVDKKLEEFRFDIKKREQAAKIAELLASTESVQDSTKKFNQLTWELSLWLPPNEVKDLAGCLTRHIEGKDPKQFLVAVRKIIHGQRDNLDATAIVHFDDQENVS